MYRERHARALQPYPTNLLRTLQTMLDSNTLSKIAAASLTADAALTTAGAATARTRNQPFDLATLSNAIDNSRPRPMRAEWN